ncbi:MAG: hypothetical protein ABSB40_11965 [Nitrososphaeria archaeon]|jgi:hypothetical protein
MGRITILTGFALLGFALGFIAYLVAPTIVKFLMSILPSIFISQVVAGAFLAGLAGAIIMDITIILWSYLSK